MPEEMLGKLKKNIRPQWKICAVSALVMGLIAHLYKLTNWLPNWDSLVFRYDAQNMLAIGRWFLPVVSALSSFYDLPWVTGLLAIVCYGLGAVCICKMFDVQKNITAGLIGAAVVSFPAVTSVMLYNYVADAYALSFLFSCIAALLITSEKPKHGAAAVLIALSVGIYQAYITVTIMLLICYLIVQLLRKDATVKMLLLKSVKFLLVGAIGMGLYYLVLMLALRITGTTLLEYQGVSNAASLSGFDILGALYIIKESFVNYFFDFSDGVSAFSIINVVVLVFTLLFYLIEAVTNKITVPKFLLLMAYVVFLPIGASVLSFINSQVDYHNLMKMGFFVFYLFLILQYEKADFKATKLNAAKQWTILLISVVLVFNHILIANISYHKLNMAYEKSYGTLIRMADRIEQAEGAEQCERILVLGALANSEAYSAKLPPDMTGTTDGFILRADDEIVGQSVLCSALNDYCGTQYTFLSGEEKTKLLEKVDVAGLESWPSKQSICVVDDVLILKLSD